MRQVLSVRFFAAMGALALLAVLVNATFVDRNDVIEAVIEQTTPEPHRIDLISAVQSFDRSEDFAIDPDGVTTGFLDVVLDEDRVVRVAPGTPGEITCPNIRSSNRCVILADLLGEAVVWFAVLPRGPRETVVLPPIVDLQDGYAFFDNGWQVAYPPVIERECGNEDIPSFSDFLRRFGPNSTSIVDLETQQVVTVVCGEPVDPATFEQPVDTSGSLTGSFQVGPTTIPPFSPDAPADAPDDAPADLPADAPADLPADIPADAPDT